MPAGIQFWQGASILNLPPDPTACQYMYVLTNSSAYWPVLPLFVSASVADPHQSDADPDPAFHFDADPDPTFHSYAYPDPTYLSL